MYILLLFFPKPSKVKGKKKQNKNKPKKNQNNSTIYKNLQHSLQPTNQIKSNQKKSNL